MTQAGIPPIRFRTRIALALLATLCVRPWDAPHAAAANEFDTYQVARLTYGANAVAFGPTGTRGTVLLGWRENFNAHGFGVATFYLQLPEGVASGTQRDDMLGLVTVWDDVKGAQGAQEALTVTTSGGAGCVLHDFRLLISSQRKPALLVVADRAMNKTFVDEETVTFKIYALKHNEAQMPGRPTYYFELTQTRDAGRAYCDVEAAFRDELGLGDYRERPQ